MSWATNDGNYHSRCDLLLFSQTFTGAHLIVEHNHEATEKVVHSLSVVHSRVKGSEGDEYFSHFL